MTTNRSKTPCRVLAIVLIGGWAAGAPATVAPSQEDDLELRTWTDSTGRYETQAAMIKYQDGKVHLRKTDGKIIAVSLSELNSADQRYVRRELARRRAMEKEQRPGPQAAARQGADWPGWRGPHRDGKSPDSGLLKQWPPEGPQLVWKVDGIGKGFSSVAVTGGMVYITGDLDGRLILYAFDLDGKPRWRAPIDAAWTKSRPGSRSTPTIDGGNLYLISGNGVVGCYDANSGKPKWTRQMREFGGATPGWGYARPFGGTWK